MTLIETRRPPATLEVERPVRVLTFLVVVGLFVTSCEGGEAVDRTQAVTSAKEMTTATSSTETSLQGTTTEPTAKSEENSVVTTTDLVYHQDDERVVAEGLVDVLAPAGGGPWPVVVAFHIHDTSRATMLPVAAEIAGNGRVVFVPEWGHPALSWLADNTLEARYDLYVEEVRCALAFAKANAADYGGDPEHITVFGRFFGANAAMMASLSDADPLDTCVEAGSGVVPQAVVSWDGVFLLDATDWDSLLNQEPEAFYAFTPWRLLDPSDDFPIHIAAAKDSGVYQRELGSDPPASLIGDRHNDIDLAAELEEMGLLDDGIFSLRDSNQWAFQTLLNAGYDARWILLPDSTPGLPSAEGIDLIVDTVVNAEGD